MPLTIIPHQGLIQIRMKVVWYWGWLGCWLHWQWITPRPCKLWWRVHESGCPSGWRGTRGAADPQGPGDHLNIDIPTREDVYLFASLNGCWNAWYSGIKMSFKLEKEKNPKENKIKPEELDVLYIWISATNHMSIHYSRLPLTGLLSYWSILVCTCQVTFLCFWWYFSTSKTLGPV